MCLRWAALGAVLWAPWLGAQQPPSTDLFATQTDVYLLRLAADERWQGSVLVVRHGETLLRRGYGLADREHAAPNKPETKYRVGSLTKAFTAAAILLLEERGRLRTEDPLCKHLDDCPESWRPITLHQLLTHTSGIPNLTAWPDYRKTAMIPSRPEETVRRFRDKPLDFAPGEGSSYSNTGYIVLARVIEVAAGETYETYLEQNIFRPLGMDGTGNDSYEAILADRAEGYTRRNGMLMRAPYHDMSIPIGGGNLYSTVDDLYRWIQALDSDALLSQQSREKMFKPHVEGGGYGWMLIDKYGRPCRHFAGGINGFSSYIASFPSDGLVVAVLSNFDFGRSAEVGEALEQLALGEEVAMPQ